MISHPQFHVTLNSSIQPMTRGRRQKGMCGFYLDGSGAPRHGICCWFMRSSFPRIPPVPAYVYAGAQESTRLELRPPCMQPPNQSDTCSSLLSSVVIRPQGALPLCRMSKAHDVWCPFDQRETHNRSRSRLKGCDPACASLYQRQSAGIGTLVAITSDHPRRISWFRHQARYPACKSMHIPSFRQLFGKVQASLFQRTAAKSAIALTHAPYPHTEGLKRQGNRGATPFWPIIIITSQRPARSTPDQRQINAGSQQSPSQAQWPPQPVSPPFPCTPIQ